VVGNRVRARVVKNKVAPPFRVAEFDIMFNQGISREGDLIELGDDMEIIRKSGAFYSYGETKLGRGREAAKAFLHQNPEIADEIEQKIRATAAHEPSIAPSPNGSRPARGAATVKS
ncbi:MAG: DNA recombination/repair protein RecA, partial [Dehalococcoidia bacterium]|nr:DNA recombination/repair protein RecA [Dehalococcoidia bacterium]